MIMIKELDELRVSLDRIDSALVGLLSERFKVTEEIGYLKAREGLAPIDKDRENTQFIKLAALAKQAQLNPAFVTKLFRLIIDEVVAHHRAIASQQL